MLLMFALYDKYISLDDSDKLWEVWQKPSRILYPCGHSGIVFLRKKIAMETLRFIQSLKLTEMKR